METKQTLKALGFMLVLLLTLKPASSQVTNSPKFVRKKFFLNPDGSQKGYKRFPCCCSNVKCNPDDAYRTSDGTCNNLAHDFLAGAAKIPFARYLPNAYEDGKSVPRGTGRVPPLPNPRKVSVAMSNAAPRSSNPVPISLLVMQFGQFTDHDFLLTHEFDDHNCCEDGTNPTPTTPECLPIDVSEDPFYKQFGIVCQRLVRSLSANDTCLPGPRQQISELTAYLDGSQVYGSSLEEQHALRSFNRGKLKIGPGEEMFTGTCPNTCPFTFLPIRLKNGTDELFGGDERVEEQPGLTSIHTLLLRVHNGLAEKMRWRYPCRSDEHIFQEVRKIVGAILQTITYGEWLPLLLGSAASDYYDLKPLPLGSGYIRYFDDIDVTPPNVLSSAAFRFGHSFIRDFFNLSKATVHLAKSFFIHNLTLTKGRYPSDFLRGMACLLAEPMDQRLVDSITNTLYSKSPFQHGLDLYAINIARARERGIPPYVAWRNYCKLPGPESFLSLVTIMGNSTAEAFKSVYRSVEDIDLFPALISELPAPGSDGIIGPTLTCLIGEFFHYLKFGDRFFFENNAHPNPFTKPQLDAIRRTTIASLLCSFMKTSQMQPHAFIVDGPGNPKVGCNAIVAGTVQDQLHLWF